MSLIRLQKYLSAMGVCSRRKGEEHIKRGDVSVNGQVVTEMGIKIDPDRDKILFKGKPIRKQESFIYIVINKPAGYVTSCHQKDTKIILDLIDIKERVYPVGRLDKFSTGLLLLTNDGRIHHKLSHPSFDHEKEYEVEVRMPISDKALSEMASGIDLDGVKTRPATIKRISKKRFRMILKEGKNRQIRRMVESVGNHVAVLHRLRMSNILLGNLKPGAWRYLTEKEINGLLKVVL